MHIRRREGVDPDAGIRKYGRVRFADPVNSKYPLDTAEHVRSAWARINNPRNAMFYSAREIEIIKGRIIEAGKDFGIEFRADTVERDAKLFTAGSYPDRGLEITEGDLERMAASHRPVPIKVEHTDSPLNLGFVTRIWREGKNLMGRLAFTNQAWALIESSSATKLSAAIRRDKSGIAEVSLVRNPRIADAAVFGESETIWFAFDIDKEENGMSDSTTLEFSNRIAELEQALITKQVHQQLDELKRSGKLAPASQELARALLLTDANQVATFADGSVQPVAQAFLAFLELQPNVIEFSELATGESTSEEVSEEERSIFAKLGVSAESAAKYRNR